MREHVGGRGRDAGHMLAVTLSGRQVVPVKDALAPALNVDESKGRGDVSSGEGLVTSDWSLLATLQERHLIAPFKMAPHKKIEELIVISDLEEDHNTLHGGISVQRQFGSKVQFSTGGQQWEQQLVGAVFPHYRVRLRASIRAELRMLITFLKDFDDVTMCSDDETGCGKCTFFLMRLVHMGLVSFGMVIGLQKSCL
ncbi:hypothetical protein NDU88_001655 [Pleurodeles waltl]|uniref:Uncharacterized protein n=1 Tax=Pleurodeles waltl TaxID=8319 RepID=A0AAV7T0X1_PLEWA|nr:hypothetical protein NDU88_001655 [Pleurodeles waltl]